MASLKRSPVKGRGITQGCVPRERGCRETRRGDRKAPPRVTDRSECAAKHEPSSVSSKRGPWRHPDLLGGCGEGCVSVTVSRQTWHCMEQEMSVSSPEDYLNKCHGGGEDSGKGPQDMKPLP